MGKKEQAAFLVVALFLASARSQLFSTTIDVLRSQCDCMEYWQCVGSGGKPYSYCMYSSKVCCFVEQGGTQPHPSSLLPHPKKSSSCGTKGPHNDRDGVTEPGEWAWHAAVLEKAQDLYVCGASLLDEFWILTAAHCVDEYRSPSSLKVRVGEYDVSSTSEPHRYEEYEVSRVLTYPSFNNRTLLHDVALLKLERPVKRRAHVNVVCLPREGDTNDDLLLSPRCYITGWGKTSESGDHSVVLKEVNVPLWRNEDCERSLRFHFGPNYKLPATTLCAGAEGRDACDGDGGGPLVCEKDGRWYQVGIVSFGIGCGQPNTPGIYTRVESYLNWIHRVVSSA